MEELYIPNKEFLESINASLTITIKVFNLSENAKQFKELISGAVGVLQGEGTIEEELKKAYKTATDIGNNLLKNIKGFAKGTGIKANEILKIHTYIPENFGLALIGDWKTKNLISIEPLVEKTAQVIGKATLDTNITSLLSMAYSNMKATAEKVGTFSLSPRQTKMFNPDFASIDLDFIFKPDTEDEADNVLKATSALRECMIPFSVTNQELFMLPALIDLDIKIIERDTNGHPIVSSKSIELQTKLFNHLKDMGITKFEASGESGENLNLAIKNAKFTSTKWSLSLTTVDRIFNNDSIVKTRILDAIKTEDV